MVFSTNEIILNSQRNVSLTTILHSVDPDLGQITKRPAVLIMPGGAYAVCSGREAEVVAYPYLAAGFHAFVLRYSVAEHRVWPNPINDYEAAMALIREKQDEWNVMPDKVAVIGFSAGGHLAAIAATNAKTRPAAAIIGYGALTKEVVDLCGPNMPYPVDCVDDDTCPCFLFAARDDSTVPVFNTIDFQRALYDHSISFEAHIYAYGEHAFSTAVPALSISSMCSRVSRWVNDSIEWLYDVLGEWTSTGLAEPRCKRKTDANSEKFLSIDCTVNYLKNQPDAQAVLADIYAAVDQIAKAQFGGEEAGAALLTGLKTLTLRNLLSTLQLPQESVQKIDLALSQMPNKREGR